MFSIFTEWTTTCSCLAHSFSLSLSLSLRPSGAKRPPDPTYHITLINVLETFHTNGNKHTHQPLPIWTSCFQFPLFYFLYFSTSTLFSSRVSLFTAVPLLSPSFTLYTVTIYIHNKRISYHHHAE